MSFVLLDDQIATHPKVLKAGAEAAWLWAVSIAYCSRQLTDGRVTADALSTLGKFKTAPAKLAAVLVEARLFDADGADFRVHDYLQHNPDRATVQQRKRDAADRKASYRAKRGQPPSGPNGNGGVPLGHSRVSPQDNDGTAASSRAHVPTPTPTPSSLRSEPTGAPSPPATPIARVMAFDAGESPTRKRLAHCAWEGTRKGLSIPQELHEEFLSKMATPDDRALRAWYVETETAWNNRAIGDTTWVFWRARFREWLGTTTTPFGAPPKVAGLAGGGTTPSSRGPVVVIDPDYRGSPYRFHCSHTPTCATWPECRDRDTRSTESRTA